jgi:acetyl esterase/lipase
MQPRLGLLFLATAVTAAHASARPLSIDEAAGLQVGFAEADITPKLGSKPVYMAGFGQNRQAQSVHDLLRARAVVLKHGDSKLALVSVDLVGFFNENVRHVRARLSGFAYVLVSSTHNHEGPDTLGLWGPNPLHSGVDAAYMKHVEGQIVRAVNEAERACRPTTARLGTARAPELLSDGRLPIVKHDELVAIRFADARTDAPVGILVQWNCHPETLGGQNKRLSADFVGYTVRALRDRYHCPVLYLTGTVGGLMTSLGVEVKDDNGKPLADGTFEKTERYGGLLAGLADRALTGAKPVRLTPFRARTRSFFLPLDNRQYLIGRQIGVLQREAFLWAGDPYHAAPADPKEFKKHLAMRTEVGWLRLGELDVAAIPGEIYPELVLDKVEDPPDPGADFPNAPVEPAIYKQLRGPYRMLIGLANDEIGYIIPKRQWDVKPPYCYGRKSPQYGEGNSVGPETAPLLCRVFKEMVDEPSRPAEARHDVILLWPEGAPGALGKEDRDKPSLTVYLPADKANGAAVVVCPGGGYGALAMDHEGKQIAEWLNARGVAAFILKYRLGPRYHHPAPMHDVQRALRTVRARAEEWHVNAKRIGVWGFSAGGHLASTAATHFDKGKADAQDPVERVSCRPDFAILAYPVITMEKPYTHMGSRNNLLGQNPEARLVEKMSNEKQVTAETPPTFLFHTSTDTAVPPENSALFYLALRKHHVPAELHIFAEGPHGVGLAQRFPALRGWPDLLATWMKDRVLLK